MIIAASSFVQPQEPYTLGPRVLTFRPDNSVDQRLSYRVFESQARQFDFAFWSTARISFLAMLGRLRRPMAGADHGGPPPNTSPPSFAPPRSRRPRARMRRPQTVR